jgi:eukaryotic-like serine/threonine-protein kinase
MVPNAIGIALLNSWTAQPTTMRPLSWITILILVYAMIAPATPRKILTASLIAASMDPLAVWIAHLRGLPVPSPVSTVLMFFPNYVCAVLAVVPSHVLHRLGRQIRKARDMGSYQLVERLGQGGMGEVWRAQHRLLARNAAIKLVRPEVLGASSEAAARVMLRRFEREAQATAALSSPHTIRVFDFGITDEGTFYYVMELLTGRDLDSLVREFGPVPADRVLYLLRQVCHSLADAHARGLVHRDIKPANIYTCRMGLEYDFVKVLDFGLVKFNDNATVQQTLATAEHTTTGTPAFMAPEMILGTGEIDRRADVYALGCVAYYLLTGELVFEADTPMKMFLHHVQTPPIPPSQRTELPIPRELDDLVMACLEKDPGRRPQDASELLRMARNIRFGEDWDTEHAQRWWEKHLLELTGPLTVSDLPVEVVDRALVTQ